MSNEDTSFFPTYVIILNLLVLLQEALKKLKGIVSVLSPLFLLTGHSVLSLTTSFSSISYVREAVARHLDAETVAARGPFARLPERGREKKRISRCNEFSFLSLPLLSPSCHRDSLSLLFSLFSNYVFYLPSHLPSLSSVVSCSSH